MKNITQRLKKNARKAGFLAAGTVASTSAFAEGTDTAITDAFAAGETTYGLAVAGIIGLAAVGVAVGMVISMMRRS